MVTHDLRNPAGTVLGIIKLLLAGKGGPLAPRQEEMLRLAQRSSEKFVSLITNYLDYSKIEAGYLKITPDEVDMVRLLQSSAEQAQLLVEAKGLTLKVNVPDGPLYAHVDADKLEQVFDNLISNAIKYTPDHGTITLTLQQSNRDLVVHVADTGNGIPKDQIGALFTKYHRVPGTERQARGTGLGLLIVKEIVEAHHGTVSVISDGIQGHGSTFTVWLPSVVSA
jgi:signal transduction histidine kinase